MKMFGKSWILTIPLVVVVVVCLVMPVSAETVTGTLGGEGTEQEVFSISSEVLGPLIPATLTVDDIEITGDMYSVILFPEHIIATDADAPTGSTATFTSYLLTDHNGGHADENVVATGTIGYQKIYGSSNPPVQLTTGYFWIVFNTWNITGRSGDVYLSLEFDHSSLYNATIPHYGGAGDNPSGTVAIGGTDTHGLGDGNWINTKYYSAHASYTATKPSGIGIEGEVEKTGNSRIFVLNVTGGILASDSLSNDDAFNFSVFADQIYINMLSPSGVWYNSSLLFSPVVPTYTWTPEPTPAPGYVRTYFENVDGRTSGQVHNSNLRLKNVQTGVWTNYTSDLDGNGYIDTLPNQSIDGYGDATGYISGSRIGVGAASEAVYEIILWPTNAFPTPSTGNVTLVVLVNDKVTALPLSSASVSVTIPTGWTYSGVTGSTGQAVFTVPNSSSSYVTASKSGYNTQTEIITTSAFGPDSLRIELPRLVIAPTKTMTPGPGGTVPVTVAPGQNPDGSYKSGYTALEGQNMLNWLAANGMQLVQLCFFVTILALLGVKLGK